MQGTTRHRPAPAPAATDEQAVVWIDRGHALIARRSAGEDAVVETLDLPDEAGIADVAHRVRQATHVLVLGPDDLRTLLEREIVAVGHHPERIREERAEGTIDRDAVLARLDRLPPAR